MATPKSEPPAGPAPEGGKEDSRLDDALKTIPDSAEQGMLDLSLVGMGFTVTASDLLFGFTIGICFGFVQAVLIAFTYSAVVAAVSTCLPVLASIHAVLLFPFNSSRTL